MRKIVIAAALLGALGFVTLAQASENAAAPAAQDGAKVIERAARNRHHEAREHEQRHDSSRVRRDADDDRATETRKHRGDPERRE